ncbi:MAG: hypothetical protein Q9219_001527 [cf. Caloplaca sp. 3 TL-2023]
MATDVPDPKTLQSWKDAFQYPIASVRIMEKQLRNDIDSNREKLRSLVGTSYRDLLGTAESIVGMDLQMQEIESYLGGLGKKCNSKILDRKGANAKAWNSETKSRENERYTLASQMAVLRGCPEVISRLLKSGGSVLLAAKILVLSRLLFKKLSQRPDPPTYLEILRDRLASLRRKLLTRIDRRFQSLDVPQPELLEAMCAFSLGTSSSAADVLRHFHHVRQSTLSEYGTRKDDGRGIFKSFTVFIKSLRDCQAVFPTQLARALEGLKSSPLLQTFDVRNLLELNLDIHQQWLGEDISEFVPYIRHDDLQKAEASRLVKQWAGLAFSSFVNHLNDRIRGVTTAAIILDLRQEMLENCISNQRLAVGVDTSEVLEGIRDAFNQRFQILIRQQSAGLSGIALATDSLLDNWKVGVSEQCPSMWDDALATLNTASDSTALREALSIRVYGVTEPLQAVSNAYTEWLNSIHGLEDVIQKMREKKWADTVDEMDDDDTLDDRQTLLSEDDPRLLGDTLEDALKQDFRKLYDMVQARAEHLRDNHNDGIETGHQACFLLRTLREIGTHLPSSYSDPKNEDSSVAMLQARVSSSSLWKPLARFQRRDVKRLRSDRLEVHVLWEGDPLLPTLPSPHVFRLLHEVVGSMTAFGVDVWTPRATGILKRQLREALVPVLRRLPEARGRMNGLGPGKDKSDEQDEDDHEKNDDQNPLEKEKTGEAEAGDEQENLKDARTTKVDGSAAPEEPSEEIVRQMKVQRLFDTLYLQRVTTGQEPDSEDALDEMRRVMSRSRDLADRDLKRMEKSAEAYWKRTELLFALLA